MIGSFNIFLTPRAVPSILPVTVLQLVNEIKVKKIRYFFITF